MNSSYDVLVVGAGPAGSLAAKEAADAGCSVLLVEKRPAVGLPIRCAEGIVRGDLEEFFEPDKKWISACIDKAFFISPDGRRCTMSAKSGETIGYTLNRKIFDAELAWKAEEAGAEVYVHALAEPLIEGGRLTGAKLTYHGIETMVHAKVVIACDGVESAFSKAAGIDTTVPLNELGSCVQYYVSGIEWDESANGLWFSKTDAPGGYIWVFSKGKGRANIGIGIPGTESDTGHRAKDFLDAFMQKEFPDAVVLEKISGGVSLSKPLKCTAADNLLIAGDAARLSDPLTGGGIYSAFVSGKLAGKWAADAVKSGDTSKQFLIGYDKAWRETRMGKELVRDYRIMGLFQKMSNSMINKGMSLLPDEIRLDKITVGDVMKSVLNR